MANRYQNWQEDLSIELVKDRKRRNVFFKGLRAEYGSDIEALRALVMIIGLKEYSNLCGLPSSNISSYLKDGKDLKVSTIKKLISPLDINTFLLTLDSAA